MLFDLQSRGRRRAIQVIYLFLALLMGGGLIFFGIGGGAGSGGLLNAVGHNSGSANGSSIYAGNVKAALKRTSSAPTDPAAWAALTKAHYQLAGVGENYDAANNSFTAKGKVVLGQVRADWNHYLALKPAKPDTNLAGQVAQALLGLADYAGATSAQELVVGADPANAAQYSRLAILAYLAGQTRKGDLSAAKAVSLAPKDQRAQVKQQLDSDKSAAQQQAAQQAQKQLGTGGGAQLPSG
ncbi:MAG: hypothetical protein NVS1B9_13020 [Solirubrobacteraceae bacterium]